MQNSSAKAAVGTHRFCKRERTIPNSLDPIGVKLFVDQTLDPLPRLVPYCVADQRWPVVGATGLQFSVTRALAARGHSQKGLCFMGMAHNRTETSRRFALNDPWASHCSPAERQLN